jgi:hypothetical protein
MTSNPPELQTDPPFFGEHDVHFHLGKLAVDEVLGGGVKVKLQKSVPLVAE